MTLTTREHLYCLAVAENTICDPPLSPEQRQEYTLLLFRAGHSQASISRLLGVSPSAVSRIVREVQPT